jgi:hypothetical protein
MLLPPALACALLLVGATSAIAQSNPVLLSKAVDPDSPTQGVLGRSISYSNGALLAGAPNSNSRSGFATVFQLDAGGRTTKVQSLSWSGSQSEDYFGGASGFRVG